MNKAVVKPRNLSATAHYIKVQKRVEKRRKCEEESQNALPINITKKGKRAVATRVQLTTTVNDGSKTVQAADANGKKI